MSKSTHNRKKELGVSAKTPPRASLATPSAPVLAKTRGTSHSARSRKRVPQVGDRVRILNSHPHKPFRGQTKVVLQTIELDNGGVFVGFSGGGVRQESYRLLPALGMRKARRGSSPKAKTGAKRSLKQPGRKATPKNRKP